MGHVYIYHLTHIDNLRSIIGAGGVHCDKEAAPLVCTAHQHIKVRRSLKAVPVAAKGTLGDYVPFYFAPRSPMLYAIRRGVIEGYDGGQEPILHLVSNLQTVVDLSCAWCFTDGHAEVDFSTFYDDLKYLSKVDWDVMNSKFWNDTLQFPDRKRKRQAEFLVHGFFPWNAFVEIGVYNSKMKQKVLEVLAGVEYKPVVQVQRGWYYD